MLKLTVKPSEYLLIGENVKIVFTGGSSNNLHVLIDAPKSCSIVRSKALQKNDKQLNQNNKEEYYEDRKISKEAVEKIKTILMEDKKKARNQSVNLGE